MRLFLNLISLIEYIYLCSFILHNTTPFPSNQIFGAVAGESNGICFQVKNLNEYSSLLQEQVEDTANLALQKHISGPGPLLSKAETRIPLTCRVLPRGRGKEELTSNHFSAGSLALQNTASATLKFFSASPYTC